MTPSQKRLKGLTLLTASTFFYSIYGILSRIIGDSFEVFFQSWTRSLITLLCFLIFAAFQHNLRKIKTEDYKWFGLVGFFGAISIAPFFYSFIYLPLGTALFIHYSGIILTSYVLGDAVYGEKISKADILALILSILGLIFVYSGSIQFTHFLPIVAAFISGALFGAYFSYSKKISSRYPTAQLNIVEFGMAVLINLLVSVALGESANRDFTSIAWSANILYGIAGFLAAGFAIAGFKYIEAHKGSLVMLCEIVFALVFGYAVFNENLGILTVVGGLLIMTSVAIPNIRKLANG